MKKINRDALKQCVQFVILLLVALIATALLAGCSGMAELSRAMAKDNGIMTGSAFTPWGNGNLSRIGNVFPGQTITIKSDGTTIVENSAIVEATKIEKSVPVKYITEIKETGAVKNE